MLKSGLNTNFPARKGSVITSFNSYSFLKPPGVTSIVLTFLVIKFCVVIEEISSKNIVFHGVLIC